MTRDELAALDAAATRAMDRALILADMPGNYAAITRAKIENAVAHDKLAHALVNLWRSGDLVMVPSVVSVIDAIESAQGKWRLDPGPKQMRQDIATAVLTSMGAKTDG